MTRGTDRKGVLGFEDFRRMAVDPALDEYARIGFPDGYRAGFEQAIIEDMACKIPSLASAGTHVVDIGCGCGGLPRLLQANASALDQRLYLVDSAEMLEQVPDADCTRKVAARFPDCAALLDELGGRAGAVIVYSVIQYVAAESDLDAFFRASLSLLAPGGRLLLGDIPNRSMRERFFDSGTGKAFHRAFTGRDEDPGRDVVSRPHDLDDAALLGLLAQARAAGFHGWLVPQPSALPMHSRREDLLVARP